MDNASTDQTDHLARLLDQRERAITLVKEWQTASNATTNRNQQRSFNDLLAISSTSQLLESPTLIPYIPLLGALDRNDIKQTKSALGLVVSETNESNLLYRLIPSYTALSTILCFALLVFQANLVVPNFERMVDDFGLRRPVITTFTFSVNQFIREHLYSITIAFITLYLISAFYSQWKEKLFEQLSRLPIGGSLFLGRPISLRKASKHALITAELIEQGMPVQDALVIATKEKHVRSGETIPSRLQIPSSITQVAQKSATTINDARHLRDISHIYDERLQLSKDSMQSVPFMQFSVLLLGIFVVLTVLSLFLPLISLVTSLS